VLFPLVALAVSSAVEGYRWTTPAIIGLVLVMAGNVLVFRPPPTTPRRVGSGLQA
jgi:drug/metabolite transporter (DMT)-like permease